MSSITDDTNAWFDIAIKVIGVVVKASEYCRSHCIFLKQWLAIEKVQPVSESVLKYDDKNLLFNSHVNEVLEKIICARTPALYDSLIHVKIEEQNYKIPAIRLKDFSTSNINDIIDITTLSRIVDLHKTDNELIAFMTNELKRNIFDKPTYRLIDLTDTLRIGISSYFQTLSTSDIHYINFIRELPSQNGTIDWEAYRCKEFLTIWETQINEILNHNFNTYSASIGGAVLTIIKKEDEYYFYAKENSKEKNGGLDGHVSPSFMYQPSSGKPEQQKEDMDLINHQIVREFGEELLDIHELEVSWLKELTDILNGYKGRQKERKLTQLSNLINKKNSGIQLFATGLVLDIFRLRPEITFLLVIENDEFLSNFKVKGNWEAKGKKIKSYSIGDYEKFLKRDSSVPDLCAPGMAALVNGMEYAKKHIIKEPQNDYIKEHPPQS